MKKDKTLYSSHRDPAKAAETVTKALNLIGCTLAIEGLSVNAIKTVSMFIRPLGSQPLDTDIHISYRGDPLKIVQKTRCLGVIVDDRLTWTSHVDCIAAKNWSQSRSIATRKAATHSSSEAPVLH